MFGCVWWCVCAYLITNISISVFYLNFGHDNVLYNMQISACCEIDSRSFLFMPNFCFKSKVFWFKTLIFAKRKYATMSWVSTIKLSIQKQTKQIIWHLNKSHVLCVYVSLFICAFIPIWWHCFLSSFSQDANNAE